MAEIYLPGWVGGWLGLTLIIRLSLSSNWTELDWTGTELGNIIQLERKINNGFSITNLGIYFTEYKYCTTPSIVIKVLFRSCLNSTSVKSKNLWQIKGKKRKMLQRLIITYKLSYCKILCIVFHIVFMLQSL